MDQRTIPEDDLRDGCPHGFIDEMHCLECIRDRCLLAESQAAELREELEAKNQTLISMTTVCSNLKAALECQQRSVRVAAEEKFSPDAYGDWDGMVESQINEWERKASRSREQEPG